MQNATIMSYKNIPEEIFQHVLNSVNVSMHHISNSRFNLALQSFLDAKARL